MRKERITVLCDNLSREKKEKQRKRNQGHLRDEGRNDMILYLIHQSMFYPQDSSPILSKGNSMLFYMVLLVSWWILIGSENFPHPHLSSGFLNYYK